MDNRTVVMVRDWLAMHNGDVEGLARWMRDSLRVGNLRQCRDIIKQAMQS